MKVLFHLSTISFLVAFAVACTKSPAPKLPDGIQKNIYPISQFDETQGEIIFSQVKNKQEPYEKYKTYGELQKLKVNEITIPNTPKEIFEDLYVSTKSTTKMNVHFKVSAHAVTLYKNTSFLSELSEIEKHIALKNGENYEVPIFEYKIKSFGVIANNTDAYGEETSTLRLQETPWEQATHIEVSLLAVDRKPLELDSNNLKSKEEFFLKNKIDNQLLTAKELKNILKLNTSEPEDSIFFTKVNGRDKLVIFQAVKSKDLTKTQLEWFKQGSSNGRILNCPSTLIHQFHWDKDDCYLVSKYSAIISHQVAKLNPVAYDGTISTTINYEEAKDATSNIVRIEPNQLLTLEEVNSGIIDPRSTFLLSQLEGEFLFRRTLNDVANGFRFTFPGAQGRLEIVKFEALENRLIVKKVDPIIKPDGETSEDTEQIMSLPAKYFSIDRTDEQGNPLTLPRKRVARFDDPNVYVEVDWANNQIPNVLSPLEYHGVGQCFQSTGGKTVTDLEQKLNDGIFNFSLSGSYTVASSGCASQYLTSDYYFRPNEQRTFNFKERVSFRKYDGSNDENYISTLPYYAQKQMNFGVFTSSKLVPNENGNIGRDGSEVHLPILFDFKNRKKVTYTLAGLPKSGTLRSSLIKATKRVVDNWNKGLREAFKGSSLETQEDLLLLEIEGEDVEDVQLGDLNKNFIYWLEKNVASGPLGIGGPSPNPRSGVIEASDIIIYGGNMKSALETVRKRASAKKFYENILKVVPSKQLTNNLLVDSKNNNNILNSKNLKQDLPMASGFQIFNFSQSTEIKQAKILAQDIQLSQKKSDISTLTPDTFKNIQLLSEAKALYNISIKIREQKAITDNLLLKNIVDNEMYEAYKDRLSPKNHRELESLVMQQTYIKQIASSIQNGHQIVEMMEDMTIAGENDIHQLSAEQLLVDKYEAVLVHEMGHALGLTHNFSGSYDKNNFLFTHENPETVKPRTSSSVMDYLPMDIWEDNAPGPYDIHAIRAAYTGRIEVDNNVQAQAKKLDSEDSELNLGSIKLTLSQGKYLHIEDYKKVLGLSSWLDFDSNWAQVIPLKKYEYCPDSEVYRYPTCNRFDYGGSPTEIVENMIKDYQAFYLLNNFPDQRLRFEWWENGSYIGRLFTTFQNIRHFMDETIFRLFNNDVSEITIDHARAAFIGMQFFHSVVRTPEADYTTNPLDRFASLELSDGRTVVFEKKWSNDILQAGGQGRLEVRGIELDKAIAMLMLTQRRLGVPEYDHRNVRMSYPDFERIFLSQNISTNTELPTITLIKEILENNLQPMAMTSLGPINLSGQPTHRVEITDLLRSISVQGAILNLDVNTLEESDNFAAYFRFGNTLGNNLPSDLTVLTQLGTQPDSPTTLKYWAFEGADVSQLLTSKALGLKYLLDKQDIFIPHLLKLILEENPLDNSELKMLFDKAPDSIGIKDLEVIKSYMENQISIAQQLSELQNSMSADQLTEIYKGLMQQNQSLSKNYPILAVVQASLLTIPDEQLANILSQFMPNSRLNIEYGLIFSNIELLNRLFYLVRPEYKN